MARLEWQQVHSGGLDPNAGFRTFMAGLEGASNSANRMREREIGNEQRAQQGTSNLFDMVSKMRESEQKDRALDIKEAGEGINPLQPWQSNFGEAANKVTAAIEAGFTIEQMNDPDFMNEVGLTDQKQYANLVKVASDYLRDKENQFDTIDNTLLQDFTTRKQHLEDTREEYTENGFQEAMTELTTEYENNRNEAALRRQAWSERRNNNPQTFQDWYRGSKGGVSEQRDVVGTAKPSSSGSSYKSTSRPKFDDFTNKDFKSITQTENGTYKYFNRSGKEVELDESLSGYIDDISEQLGIPPEMLVAFAGGESAFDPNATSPTGVKGIMQVTEKTGAMLREAYPDVFRAEKERMESLKIPFNPENRNDRYASMFTGAQYIKHLIERENIGTNPRDIYMAYNLGPSGSKELRDALNDPNVDRSKSLKDLNIEYTSQMDKNSGLYSPLDTLEDIDRKVSNFIGYDNSVERASYAAARAKDAEEVIDDPDASKKVKEAARDSAGTYEGVDAKGEPVEENNLDARTLAKDNNYHIQTFNPNGDPREIGLNLQQSEVNLKRLHALGEESVKENPNKKGFNIAGVDIQDFYKTTDIGEKISKKFGSDGYTKFNAVIREAYKKLDGANVSETDFKNIINASVRLPLLSSSDAYIDGSQFRTELDIAQKNSKASINRGSFVGTVAGLITEDISKARKLYAQVEQVRKALSKSTSPESVDRNRKELDDLSVELQEVNSRLQLNAGKLLKIQASAGKSRRNEIESKADSAIKALENRVIDSTIPNKEIYDIMHPNPLKDYVGNR